MNSKIHAAPSVLSPQNPYTGVLGAFTGLGLCSYLAICWGEPGWWGSSVPRSYLLWSIVGVLFILMGVIDQWGLKGYRRGAQIRPAYHRSIGRLLYSACWRFAALVLALSLARYFYFNHTFYLSTFYAPFRQFFGYFYKGFLITGFPYIAVTLRWRGNLKDELKDPAVHILLWIRSAFRLLLVSLLETSHLRSSRMPRQFLKTVVFRNRRTRVVLLGFLVEFFYLPLMTVFVTSQFNDFAGQLNRYYYHLGPRNWSEGIYPAAYHGVYLMDVLLATGGYAFPLRWLDNKIVSVEPTLMGWVVALICYPPFDAIPGYYLLYGNSSNAWMQNVPELVVLSQILAVSLAAIYALATMMFGTRFSNLTNRGILNRGPYAIVRHPAYIAKNLSWWFEKLPMMSNPWNILTLFCWNIVYGLRAWTEERHLSADPAYRAYREQVKYRFIPGIF